MLNDLEPRLVVVGTNRHIEPASQFLKKIGKKSTVLGVSGFDADFPEEFQLFNPENQGGASSLPVAAADDIATIIYTGGTTGTPKGIMHSQYGMAANLISNCMENPFDDRDRVLLCTPLQG